MKNWFLSNPYLIRLINQKLFTIVFSSLILLLKKNEYSVLLLQNLYLVQLFHIHTMIIFMHGSSSCYTNMLLWPALGLLSLIKISILSFLCGLSIGGHNLALLLIFFSDLWLAPSSILQVFLTQTHMMLTAKFLHPYILLKNTRCHGFWNGNMSRKAMFLLGSGMLNGGTHFPTLKMLLIMLPRNSWLLLKALLTLLLRLSSSTAIAICAGSHASTHYTCYHICY